MWRAAIFLLLLAWPAATQRCNINATVSGWWDNRTTWIAPELERPPCGDANNAVCVKPNITLNVTEDKSVEELFLEPLSEIFLLPGASLTIGNLSKCDSPLFPYVPRCNINVTVPGPGTWNDSATWVSLAKPPCAAKNNSVCLRPGVNLTTVNNDSSVEEIFLEKDATIYFGLDTTLTIGATLTCNSVPFPTTTTTTTRATTGGTPAGTSRATTRATTTSTKATTTRATTTPSCNNDQFCSDCRDAGCRTCLSTHYLDVQGKCPVKGGPNAACVSSSACQSACCKDNGCADSSECQEASSGGSGSMVPAIAGGAAGGLVVLILIIVLVARHNRKRNIVPEAYRTPTTTQMFTNPTFKHQPNDMYESGPVKPVHQTNTLYEGGDGQAVHRVANTIYAAAGRDSVYETAGTDS